MFYNLGPRLLSHMLQRSKFSHIKVIISNIFMKQNPTSVNSNQHLHCDKVPLEVAMTSTKMLFEVHTTVSVWQLETD